MDARRIPELDGLRAFAIIPVLITHSAALQIPHFGSFAVFGWIGVDLFFVLSGYLITGILLNAKLQPKYYRNFYARRALRIWPIYFGLLLVVALIHTIRPQTNDAIAFSPWAFIFFVQNLFPLRDFGRVLGPTWSLGVEEQFYFVWPLIVAMCSPKTLLRICGALIILSPIARLWVTYLTHDWQLAYTSTYCRIDGLACGAAVAVITRQLASQDRRLRAVAIGGMCVGAPLLTSFFMNCEGTGLSSFWIFSAVAVFMSSVLMFVLSSKRGWFKATLNLQPLRYIGKISYCLYLSHVLVNVVFEKSSLHAFIAARNGTLPILLVVLIQLSLSLILASASWYFVESPILRLKKHFDVPEAATAAASA